MKLNLPGPVVDALMAFREVPVGAKTTDELLEQVLRDLAAVGWQLVPESVIPRAGVLAESARLLQSSAALEGPPSGISPSGLTDIARYMEYLHDLAASLLGVDLSDLAEYVDGAEPS